MKKLALIFTAVLMMASLSQAQHVFDKGDIAINAGIGVGGYDGLIPSIEASVEFGVIPTGDVGLVSFGGALGYKYSTYDYYYLSDYNYSYHQFQFGGRAAWHLHTFTSDKWDAYAGLGLGVRMYSVYDGWDFEKDEATNKAKAGLYEEVFVGGRMMLKPGFGLFAELGYSHLSNIRFGLTFGL